MGEILDHVLGIEYPDDSTKLVHELAIDGHLPPITYLAEQLRLKEQQLIEADEYPVGALTFPHFSHYEPLTYAMFNWFAISLTSYLRLIAMVGLVNREGWGLRDLLGNHKAVEDECSTYVASIVPAVLQWRHKIAAHPAVTAPRVTNKQSDRLATLIQSFTCPVRMDLGYLEVGGVVYAVEKEKADLQPWSVTATYEKLTSRFWPDAPLTPHRHRPGWYPDEDAVRRYVQRG